MGVTVAAVRAQYPYDCRNERRRNEQALTVGSEMMTLLVSETLATDTILDRTIPYLDEFDNFLAIAAQDDDAFDGALTTSNSGWLNWDGLRLSALRARFTCTS
jgi:hypothetical protein